MAEPRQPQHLRVFLSSPGDVAEERELARRLIKDELPVDAFLRGRVTFDVVSWDDQAAPTPMTAGLTPQEAVDRFGAKPSECDFVVVVLWSRMGTLLDVARSGEKPGGGPYLSGTEWEFEDAWAAWKARKQPEILVYRRTEEPKVGVKDPARASEAIRQYGLVEQFFGRFENPDRSLRGGWTGYDTPARFKERLASDLRRFLRERLEVERVAAEKGVPVAPLRAVLTRYGEHEEVPEHEIPARLARWAEEFATVRERLERRTNDPPEAEAARHRAAALLDASDLDGAQAVLAEARRGLRENRERTAREEAAVLADEARVHRLRLDYGAAAAALQEAAGLVAGFDPAQAWRHTLDAGDALTDQGHEFGDNAALGRTIAVYHDALALAPRTERPEDWAATQNDLGIALRLLGEHEAGAERLEQAVEAFRATLEVRTRERFPTGWAATQNELGIALRLLGEREAGAERLEQAVEAFRAALEVRTRERFPTDWAWTQDCLGVALLRLEEREAGAERLEQAVEAFRAALEVRTRERFPTGWATTQNNLGVALHSLGEREAEAGAERLEQAVEAFRAALEVRTRERFPTGWAATQNVLGVALHSLGEREAGAERLEQAVEAFRAALEVHTRERHPLAWALNQANLAMLMGEIGRRTGNPAQWQQEALRLVEAALEVFRSAGASYYEGEAYKVRDKLLDGAHS